MVPPKKKNEKKKRKKILSTFGRFKLSSNLRTLLRSMSVRECVVWAQRVYRIQIIFKTVLVLLKIFSRYLRYPVTQIFVYAIIV